MISLIRTNLSWLCFAVAGLALAAIGGVSLNSSDGLKHDRNPMAVYGSAYGRLMARLSETTVDRVWHLGVEQIVPHNVDGSHAHVGGSGHDHHGHSHGEEDHNHDHHGHSHGEDDHGHGHSHAEDVEKVDAPEVAKGPVLEQLKDWFNGMRVVKYTRTNPYSLNEGHLATVKKEIEGMLLSSYRMDPGHYGAYNSYHLFLTTHDFGGTSESRKHAATVANATIAAVFHEDEDPEPWLTAASAAMNLYLLNTETHMVNGTPIPLDILTEYRSKIGYCLSRFEELQAKAEENGNWENLSFERQYEIVQRHRFASRTFKQFDAMIARAEKPASPSAPEARVAESIGGDE